MRVLLIGANGYLGRFVADRLLADPAVQLTALGRGDDADVRFDLASGSPGALTRFLDAVHPGVVINCAGTTRGGARELTRHNTVAVATVCEALRRSGCGARLVQIGCAAEYGPSQPGSSTAEDAVPRPGGPYGVSKLAATELVLGSGLDAVVLRVFSPAGPGTPAGSPLGRLAEAMRRAMQTGDGELKLGGLGAQRDFVDVRDVARAVHAASLSAAQGVINIGSGRAVRLRDAAAILARVAGYGGALHELDGPPGAPRPAIGHPRPEHLAHPRTADLGHRADPDPAPHATYTHGTHTSAHTGHAAHTPPSIHTSPAAYPYPDGCGTWQQADVRTARDRLGWRPRINLEESLADIWMEAACRI
ncbi:NAD-dependent epimerase/dehydratase family protein [Streptomyces cinereospinus]|uniref:NAD-dependent epimerase/dehydratase family protein n=1 Tax=Streptomyces cinereospinus TaxID=285561 RepID=A0ABV5N0E1_9ACTN